MAEIDLNDLAERVEKLDGPSRAVDAEIAWLTRWRWDGWDEEDVRIEDRSLEYVIERVENGFNSIWRNIPRYTESIDAALALVPEGVDWMIDNFDGVVGRRCSASVHMKGDWIKDCHAKTPALAMCAAALRAIASQEGK